jgi:exoribonuclease R
VTFRRLSVAPNAGELTSGFERIRAAMHLDAEFPKAATDEAERAAANPAGPEGYADALDIGFVTIDPPGSRDLDQAFHAEMHGDLFRVHYAIADVGAFVAPGSALDKESWARGQTLYCPDRRIPLYPAVLGEGAASLLPDQVRPSVLWTIDLDDQGTPVSVKAARARVRSRRQMTYEEAQAEIDKGQDPSLTLLRTVGELRSQQERARGGINLEVPEQEVHRTEDGFELAYRAPLPVEGWNAQISLLTGICAAKTMLGKKVGLIRTMPAPDPAVVQQLRLSARALGVEWPEGETYATFISSLDPSHPTHAALLTFATRLFRGTGYAAFDGEIPALSTHHALATEYAHATAPLRRLADRYVNEVVVSLDTGDRPPTWVLEGLPRLPEVMKEAHRREGELERRILDYLEAATLAHQIGHTFEGVVVEEGKNGATIQLRDPAVIARCEGACGALGADVKVKVSEADPVRGRVVFEAVSS